MHQYFQSRWREFFLTRGGGWACWPGCELIRARPRARVHIRCELDVPPRRSFKGMLHSCEHTPRYRNSWDDVSHQPQELPPLAQGGSARLPRDGHKCGCNLLLLSRGEAKQVGNRVQVPPENHFMGGPCPISLYQII